MNCGGSSEIIVLAAHTDTVFSDMEPMPYREYEENIYCPGDNVEALAIMQQKFEDIFAAVEADGVQVSVEKIGDRPCAGEVDAAKLEILTDTCSKIVEDVIEESVIYKSASMDCNIPISLGIPAVCIGVYRGGSHTREEWVEKASLRKGLEIALRVAMKFI